MHQGQEVVVIPAKKVELFSAVTGIGTKKRVAVHYSQENGHEFM